jgi:hypothetical protein
VRGGFVRFSYVVMGELALGGLLVVWVVGGLGCWWFGLLVVWVVGGLVSCCLRYRGFGVGYIFYFH